MKVKQFIIATILLIFVQGDLMAQIDSRGRSHFIPKVGLNISNVSGTGGADPRFGINAGVSFEKRFFFNVFAYECGVYYSMQGMRFSSGNYDFNLDYINVPFLLKGYEHWGLNFFFGPQLGINVRAKVKDHIKGETVDYKKYTKMLDPAIVVGIGHQFKKGLSASVSYNWGFLNQANKKSYIDFEKNKYHHHVLQFNVGWRY